MNLCKIYLTVGGKPCKCFSLHVQVSLLPSACVCVYVCVPLTGVQGRDLFTRNIWAQFPKPLKKNLHNFQKTQGRRLSFQKQTKNPPLLGSICDRSGTFFGRGVCFVSAFLQPSFPCLRSTPPPVMLKCK